MYGTSWIASSDSPSCWAWHWPYRRSMACGTIHGMRAVKDDLHLATATAASCQELQFYRNLGA